MILGDFLEKYRIEIRVEDSIEYNQVTISQHTGVNFRGKKLGVKIGRKRQFLVDLDKHPNTVMFTRQGVIEGAIGLAPRNVHNCIVTENMPTLTVNTNVINIEYLKRLLTSQYLQRKISKLSTVGSAQKSIHERDLLKVEIDLPDLKTQKIIAQKFLNREKNYFELLEEIQLQKSLLTQLKQAILQEAIQGELTRGWRVENPELISGENSATTLLENIKAEKAQLVKEKKIKKEKLLPPIEKEEIPFELPEGWVWCRMQEAGLFERGKSKHRPRNDKSLFEGGTIPFVQTGDVARSKNSNYLINSCTTYYNNKGLDQSRLWPKGTMCITIAANIAQTGFLNIDACFPDSVVGFTSLSDNSISKYIRFFIDLTKTEIEKFAPATAQKNINLGIINLLKLPLPPEEEQIAIVKKVEALMEKCTVLEQEITKSEQHAKMLMQAVLKEAFESGTVEDTPLSMMAESKEKYS